jgi:hypothetical protein
LGKTLSSSLWMRHLFSVSSSLHLITLTTGLRLWQLK